MYQQKMLFFFSPTSSSSSSSSILFLLPSSIFLAFHFVFFFFPDFCNRDDAMRAVPCVQPKDVEWALSCSGALETEMEGNPRTVHKEGANKAPFGMRVTDATRRSLDGKSKKSGSHDSDSSDSDDD